jgi:hypothetical protein
MARYVAAFSTDIRKLLEKAIPAWSEAQQQVKKVLGRGFVDQLNQTMKRDNKSASAE